VCVCVLKYCGFSHCQLLLYEFLIFLSINQS